MPLVGEPDAVAVGCPEASTRQTAAGYQALPVLVTLPSRFSSAAMRWSESPCPASRATSGAIRFRNATADCVRSARAAEGSLPCGAEPGSPRLRGCERRLGAFGDHLALVLGDGGQDMQREPVGLRHVAAEQVDAAFQQAGDEGDVARQPVELGDEQRGVGLLGMVEGLLQFRPVGALAALDLDVLRQQPASARRDEALTQH